jgi:hypothetical protein
MDQRKWKHSKDSGRVCKLWVSCNMCWNQSAYPGQQNNQPSWTESDINISRGMTHCKSCLGPKRKQFILMVSGNLRTAVTNILESTVICLRRKIRHVWLLRDYSVKTSNKFAFNYLFRSVLKLLVILVGHEVNGNPFRDVLLVQYVCTEVQVIAAPRSEAHYVTWTSLDSSGSE